MYADLLDKLEVCSATGECVETQQADRQKLRESTISVLVTCTVLPQLCCANQQAAQHEWFKAGSRGKAQEVYDCQICRRCKTAISDRSKVSASCLSRALPRELSRFCSYACHSCTGGLNLHSDLDNLDACVCTLLQSAAPSLRTREKHAPSQPRAAVTRDRQR